MVGSIPKPVTFNVVEPSGVIMTQTPGTGIFHVTGTASAGFLGTAFITPEDVSFKNIQVREGTVNAVATGILQHKNGEVHQNGSFFDVIQGTTLHPNQWDAIDTISTGVYQPPFTGGGTFTWPIPWLFKTLSVVEKPFTTVTHLEQVDSAGRTTISKTGVSGVSVPTNASDPTTSF